MKTNFKIYGMRTGGVSVERMIKIILMLFPIISFFEAFSQEGTNITNPVNLGIITSFQPEGFVEEHKIENYGNNYGGAAPEIFYKFTVTGNTEISIGLGGITQNHIYLLNSNGVQIASQSYNVSEWYPIYLNVSAGTYYLVVEGAGVNNMPEGTLVIEANFYVFDNSGVVTPTEGINVTNAISIDGSTGAPINYIDSRSNSPVLGYGNKFHTAYNANDSDDIYYKFSLDGSSSVNVSTCDPKVYFTIPTSLYIFDSSGNLMASNDGTGSPCYNATIQTTLGPGTYYIIVESLFSYFGGNYTLKLQTNPLPTQDHIQTLNKITTEIVKIPGITTDEQLNNLNSIHKQNIISYWDGLKRTIQTIDQKGSPAGNDIVQLLVYDRYGKQSTQYLPYVSGNTTGNFNPDAISEQAAFYNIGDKVASDSKPYALTKHDNSPLDLIVEQGGVGEDFQPGTGHTTKSIYRVNSSSDQVIHWTMDGPGTNYLDQDLLVTELTDQNGNKTFTFTDKSGKLLLKKAHLDEDISEGGSTQHVDYLETYYIYDDLGNLIYQVPPKATAKIKAGSTWNTSFIDEWVFKYTYDENSRLIEKKVPGSSVAYVVYDQLGRPVMTQDAKLRSTGKWIFTKYDLKQRPIEQGLYTFTELYSGTLLTQREQLQKYYDELDYDAGANYYHENRQAGTTHGYSNQAFPTANIIVSTVNYYDDYDFNYDNTPDYSYVDPSLAGAATKAHMLIQGQLTGSKKVILGTNTWLTSVVFYDRYGRAIEKRSNNQLYHTGLNDLQALVYEGFSAAPKLSKQVKLSSASVNITVNNRYEYDHRNRLKQVYQSHNGTTEQLVAQYIYNEIGQLIDKSLHAKNTGGFLQSLDYRYTIQGWLSRINNSNLTAETDDNGVSDLFGMEMAYHKEVSGLTTSADTRYDGSLSSVRWKTNDIYSSSSTAVYERSYKFGYDKVGRLQNAVYSAFNGTSWSAEAGGYDERDIKYDHNGNILGLKRYSINIGTNSPVLIDDLSYTYTAGSGNQLKQVEDASANTQGFKDNTHLTDEYEYDESGNLVKDKNKGDGIKAMEISYNDLNKISRVDLPGGKYILYTYAATGERLRKETHDNTTVKTTDYIDGFVYENSMLAYFPMAEGRVRNAAGVLKYEYFITDQQGNVRVNFEEGLNGLAKIVQENHYYPFGLAMKGAIIRTTLPSTPNKNLYNGGSELQDDFSDDPNVYSTFFREYDPVLGRMNAVDPMADKYGDLTPYNYAGNNPIMFNDPMGDDFNNREELQSVIDRLMASEYGGFATGIDDVNEYGTSFGALIDANYYLDKYKGWGTNGAVDSFETAYANYTISVTGGYNPVDAQGNALVINGTSGSFAASIVNVQLYKRASKGGGWDNSKLALDIGGGIYGAMEGLTSSQGQWLGTNGKYYRNSWGGNQYTGSRSGAFKAAGNYKLAGRVVLGVSAAIGVVETINGYQKDGGRFGYNAHSAVAQTAGSLAGGWAGAEAGAALGGAIGVWFGGVGAIPGAVIGGVIGGFVGGYYAGQAGGKLGQGVVNYYYGK